MKSHHTKCNYVPSSLFTDQNPCFVIREQHWGGDIDFFICPDFSCREEVNGNAIFNVSRPDLCMTRKRMHVLQNWCWLMEKDVQMNNCSAVKKSLCTKKTNLFNQ